jgi:hypothetical protein
VGDHHDRLAEVVDGAAQQREDVGRGASRSRLPVGSSAKTTGRAVIERAGHGDALLLAAGLLAGPVRAAVVEADGAMSVLQPPRVGLAPAIESGRTTFSSAVRTGRRLNAWKMNRSCRGAAGSGRRRQADELDAVDQHDPVSAVQPAGRA